MSFLASVSDLMASLMFIFIITLVIFVLHLSQATGRLESATATRAEVLKTIQQQLAPMGLAVLIDTAQGLLRLQDSSINFPVGAADPRTDHLARVAAVGRVLRDVVPCFVEGMRERCRINARPDTMRFAASVETILIEGHTDTRPIRGSRFRSNMELSGARASRIREIMTDSVPALDSLRNRGSLSILSISGYGEFRLADSASPFAESNRRIDLRFLMEPPEVHTTAAVVAEVANRLKP